MYTLDATDSYAIEQPSGTYVYDIVPVAGGIVSISSDDTVRLFDPSNLQQGPVYSVPKVNSEVTCLEALDHQGSIVCTAGRDGKVTILDLRQQSRVAQIGTGHNAPILSLATCKDAYAVAAGTELTNSQAEVIIWDTRSLNAPRVQYTESHNDDVTELQYHPTETSILLSGSTDGLVNLYNTTVLEEEDALHQTLNHGSSIHKAGFLNDLDIFALSHDEKFAVYPMITNIEASVEEPPSTQFGDLRESLGCEYVASVLGRPNGGVVGIGSHRTCGVYFPDADERYQYSQSNFSLVQLKNSPPWAISTESPVTLSGGHGGEVVRSFCFLDEFRMIITGGEDGQIKAWKFDG